MLGPPITESQITSVIPDSFAGKEDFVRFYLRHNGGYFEGGAIFPSDKFYLAGDHPSAEVEEFFFIPRHIGEKASEFLSSVRLHELRAQWYGDLNTFIETHFPFAGDGSYNDYWIEIPTGRIKYTRWESFREGWCIRHRSII